MLASTAVSVKLRAGVCPSVCLSHLFIGNAVMITVISSDPTRPTYVSFFVFNGRGGRHLLNHANAHSA